MKIIAVEGNVGSGKSTLVEPLADELTKSTGVKWSVIKEPVDEDPEFKRLLTQFIESNDPDKRIEFQMYITKQRQELLQNIPDGNYIIERSLFSDLVFSQCYFLTMECPSGAYMSYYYDIKKRLTEYPKIDLIVYLNRSPDSCLESIIKRGREGESYAVETLEDLSMFHLACLPQISRQYETPLMVECLGEDYAKPKNLAEKILENGEFKF